ncbi:hypothetical protein BDV19DRAFT_394693 [Aspergillus venezuelensis]
MPPLLSLILLPPEIFHRVCTFLPTNDITCIHDLSLSCKALSDIAHCYRFQYIKVRISGRPTLVKEVREWTTILNSASAFPFYDSEGEEDETDEYYAEIEELVWACRTVLPPCILHVLKFSCQVHNVRFTLPSLEYEDYQDSKRDVDPYEFELATSERIVTIAASICPMNSEAAEAARERPWPGFFVNKDRREHEYQQHDVSIRSSPGQLVTLAITPGNDLYYFSRMKASVSFSRLRNLQLWQVSAEVLEAAARCNFSSLRSLALGPEYGLGDEDQVEGDKAAAELIGSLPKMRSIHLSTNEAKCCQSSQTFEAILEQHGDSLEKLSLVGPGDVEFPLAEI